MTWPFSITLGGVTADDYLDLLMRLMPDGYSQDLDGPRVGELEAYAHALWIGRGAIDRASAQAFLEQATELLEEWEQVYALPNDAARTEAERQARLVLAERANAGASPQRIADAMFPVAPLAEALANTQEEIAKAACLASLIWHVGVQVDTTEWEAPQIRRALARVLRRVFPARLHSVPDFRLRGHASGPLDDGAHLFTTEGATWASANAVLGRTVLARQTASQRAVGSPANRLVEYGPLVRIEAADLNALQDAALMRPCAGAGVVDAYAGAGTDQRVVHFSVRANASSEVTIDTSIDWRNRYIWTTYRTNDDGDDIRPGEADDDVAGGGAAKLWISLTGDTSSLAGTNVELSTDHHLYADSTTGALKFYNATAGARSIVGRCLASPVLSGGTSGRLHAFEDGGDLSGLTASMWTALHKATLDAPQSESSPFTGWPGDGALNRMAVVTGLERGEVVILDAEADWRDRLVTIMGARANAGEWSATFTGPAHPGSPNDNLSRTRHSAGYTAAGRSDADDPDHGHAIPIGSADSGGGTALWVFADSTTGALKIGRTAGDTETPPDTLWLVVMASQQLGINSTPDALPAITATDATPIEPYQLNGWQDRALLGQVRGEDIDAFPLGPKLDVGGVPELWTVRGETVRQPVAGMPLRFFYATCADGAEVVVDDSIDWRDRLVFAVGRRSTSAIGAGGASQSSHNVATGFTTGGESARYTGPGDDSTPAPGGYVLWLDSGSAQLVLRARPSDGALMLANETGSTQYVTGIVGASFQLGPRSST